MRLLAAFLLALLVATQSAFGFPSQLKIGGSINTACPSPTTDGSTIFPGSNCPISETGGNTWNYNGTSTLTQTPGSVTVGGTLEAQRNSGGHFYWETLYPNGSPQWTRNGGFRTQEISPSSALIGSVFQNVTKGVNYVSFEAMLNSVAIGDGDHLLIPSNPAGIQLWTHSYQIGNNNLRITLGANTIVGQGVAEGNSFFTLDEQGGARPLDGVIIEGTDMTSQIAYQHNAGDGSYKGITYGGSTGTNWTAQNLFIHDNDTGLQACSAAAGKTGTITNVLFKHNGNGLAPGQSSSTHNVYLTYCPGSTNTSTVAISGGGSICTNDVFFGGFQYKLRWAGGTLTNAIAAEANPDGYTDCAASAAIDISCGGEWTIGGTTPGSGVVVEIGPSTKTYAGNGEAQAIRFGAEGNNTNCPLIGPNGHGWANNDLLVQNTWVILDTANANNGSPPVVGQNNPARITGTFTVKNSKIVCNGNQTCDAAHALGSNVTDGGGNTFYADRTAASLPPYPALPAVM